MLNIAIKTLPHNEQRYPTCGDWFFRNHGEELHIRVSCMNDWRKEICVALHELIEVILCKDRGISQKEVDIFDMEFEAKRVKGNVNEPGDSILAPYHNEHVIAGIFEQLMAHELMIDWKKYEETINSL